MAELFVARVTNPSNPSDREIFPQFIPSSLTDLTANDIHLTEVVVSNVTASPVTFTIQDKQATPTALFASVSVPANSVYSVRFRGRWCPGGLSWSASAGNALIAAVRGY
jgi:hypothetical protein